jgi:hypothetical protein
MFEIVANGVTLSKSSYLLHAPGGLIPERARLEKEADMNGDEQDRAESLDDEVFDADSDVSPDFSSENDLENYPGDHYLGVHQHGETEREAHTFESDEARTAREESDPVVEELNLEAKRAEDEERAAAHMPANQRVNPSDNFIG